MPNGNSLMLEDLLRHFGVSMPHRNGLADEHDPNALTAEAGNQLLEP